MISGIFSGYPKYFVVFVGEQTMGFGSWTFVLIFGALSFYVLKRNNI
jgi:hypothetical protein